MTKEEAALKAIQQARRKMMDDFIASDEGQLWTGDVFAGLGVTSVTGDGKIERIKPRDFFIDQKACPECGGDQWMNEMGGSIELRHFRGCSQWHSYFDGGVPTTEALEGKK